MSARTAGRPLIIAHRGASHDAPENTLAAFRLGWAQGADGMECDVHRTRDGRLVCIHDANARRTTGVNRLVARASWGELRALDAGRWKGAQWAGTRLPLLEEILAELPRGKRIQVEVKGGLDVIPPLVPLLRAVPAYRRRVQVIAFDTTVIRALKTAAPDLCALWLTGYRRAPENRGWLPATGSMVAQTISCGADGVGSQAHAALTAPRAAAVRAHGLALTVWTVDAPAGARRLARLGVDAIATNRPGWLRERLGW